MKSNPIIYRVLLILFLFVAITIKSQINLVPNPSFEEYNPKAPTTKFCQNKLVGAILVEGWQQPTKGTADYHNSDKSTVHYSTPVHKARTGQGRIGFILDEFHKDANGNLRAYKEYIQCQLIQPLIKDKLYSVNFFVTLDKRNNYSASSIGAYFSSEIISNNSYQPFMVSPQIETSDTNIIFNNKQWSLVHGYYTAKGGEKYLTIGSFGANKPLNLDNYGISYNRNFQNKSFYNKAYYYLDDVSIYAVNDSTKDEYKKLIIPYQTIQPYNNLTLLLGISSNINGTNNTCNIKNSVDSLISFLDTNETISIITLDNSKNIPLKSIKASNKSLIYNFIDSLKESKISDANNAIKKAYELSNNNYISTGNNQVILITDLGFNISPEEKIEIKNHFNNKLIGFSVIMLNDVKYPKLKRICERNNGLYCNADCSNIDNVLQQHIGKRQKQNNYTEEKVVKNKPFTVFIGRGGLHGINGRTSSGGGMRR